MICNIFIIFLAGYPLISLGVLVQTSGPHTSGPGFPFAAQAQTLSDSLFQNFLFITNLYPGKVGKEALVPIINFPMLNTPLVQPINRIPIKNPLFLVLQGHKSPTIHSQPCPAQPIRKVKYCPAGSFELQM